MALTIKTTGLAAKARWVMAVDDNNVIKCFKSLNSSGSDNTAAVNTDMTISGTLSYSTMAWGGGSGGGNSTLRTVKSVSSSYVQFGTNKPWITSSANPTNGLLCVYIGQQPASGSLITPSAGRIPYPGSYGSPQISAFVYTGGIFFTNSVTQVPADSKVLLASRIKGSDSTNNRFYLAFDDGAVADDGYTGNSNFESCGNNDVDRFLVDSGVYWTRETALYLIADDDYASSAARISDLESLLQDPYGYLFDSSGSGATLGGSSVSVARGTTGVNASVSL